MRFERASGILLHPTSLPGPYGIGDFGREARLFVDFLVESGQTYWQILPLVPTGYGDCPYNGFSAFAGNPMLISLDRLLEVGWLDEGDLGKWPESDHVDFGRVNSWKTGVLKQAFENFMQEASLDDQVAFGDFCQKESAWLDDYSLFMSLGEFFAHHNWAEWPNAIRKRKPAAMHEWKERLANSIEFHQFLQFLFFRHYFDLKAYAGDRGIKIVGDLPIFLSYESADVWANPQFFKLDEEGHRLAVAGVPPDYFSETGQLWGNPLYDWQVMEKDGFAWWIARFRSAFNLFDVIRVDHFRGFDACWEVPAEEETAINGEWVPTPGNALFHAVENELGRLPIIAEDLGTITPPVEALRDGFGFPGMKILQFAFDRDPNNAYLPHNMVPHCIAYTGTHDNDTTRGWYNNLSPKQKDIVRRYLACDGHDISWDLIRSAMVSVAELAVIPLQDILDLPSSARMNTPGLASGNWGWRFKSSALPKAIAHRLREMTHTYGRSPEAQKARKDDAVKRLSASLES